MSPASVAQDHTHVDRRHGLRLAVVEAGGLDGALASLFARQDNVMVLLVSSVAELLDRVGSGELDAVLLDPELPEGWPVSVAEQVVEGLNGRLPLAIACRSPADAKVIGDRLGGSGVFVVLHAHLEPIAMIQLLAGAAASMQAGTPTAW